MSSTPDTANRGPQGPFDPLLCPVCGLDLRPAGRSLHCAHQHTFDRARQGYVSLLTGDIRAPSADTAAMVQARATFLAGDHYAPLARSLARLVPTWCPANGMVLDAGVGTGYYLAAILESLPQAFGLGLDSSKFALRRAARAHPRIGAVAWDVWRPLPVRTGSVDVLVNVFAPRNGGSSIGSYARAAPWWWSRPPRGI